MAQMALNQLLAGIGRVDGLSLDREAKRLALRLQLEGEERAIAVSIEGWKLEDDGWSVERVVADRSWLAALASRLLCGRKLPYPPGVPRSALSAVL